MAIKKLIEDEDRQNAVENLEKARAEFIRGGGKVSADFKKEPISEEWMKINLRIKKEAVMMIDEAVNNTMGLTRTGWILQAIEEKLKNERNLHS